MGIVIHQLSRAQAEVTVADAFTIRYLDLGELIEDTRSSQAHNQLIKLTIGQETQNQA
jgi:hypothetical protein